MSHYGLDRSKIRPEHLARAAFVYIRQYESSREICQLIDHAAQQMGAQELRTHIQDGLRLRGVVLDEARGERQQRFGWILTILLGIGAVDTVADRLLQPLADAFGWKLGALKVSGLSLAVVLVLVGVAWRLTLGRKPEV